MKFKLLEKTTESLLFMSRWVQAPVYFALIVSSMTFAYYVAVQTLQHTFHLHWYAEIDVMVSNSMIGVIENIDATMVLNLAIVVLLGGWSIFVSKITIDSEDKPEWLEKINAYTLKSKLTDALVSISAILMLKVFLRMAENPVTQTVDILLMMGVHIVYLATSIAFSKKEKASGH